MPGVRGRIPGFTLRSVVTNSDVERFVELNQEVTGEGAISRRLVLQRPGSRREDFIMVVEDATDRVVSTTCLLPWHLSYEGVELRAAMLEMVVTHPDYRRHGLVRAQVEAFHEGATASGVDLCIIQGIPYYYRQFGYAYALDHTPTVRLSAAGIPLPGSSRTLRLRPAGPDDLAAAAHAYDAEMGRQHLVARRAPADWAYLVGPAGRAVQILERDGRTAGYALTVKNADTLTVDESGLEDIGDSAGLLGLLAAAGPHEIAVVGNSAHALAGAAATLGGRRSIPGQWLVRIVDPCALMRRLSPVFERRLAKGSLPGRDAAGRDVVINLFRRALRLRLEGHAFRAVEDLGFVDASMGADGGDLCIPPDAFARLLLGYRGLDELRDAWPDITVRAGSREILDALFPRRDSLVLMPY